MPRYVRNPDEDDVRVRPRRGNSRPRSKSRPAHADASSGMVVAVDRGRFTIMLDDDTEMYAMKAREIGRKGIVVGDRVDVVGDLSGATDSQGRIVRRLDRGSVLRRTADDTDPVERVIVANADQLAIVTATADPQPRTGLIDRALVAAYDAGIEPLLIITKTDLASPADLIATYAPLDLRIEQVVRGHASDALLGELLDRTTVLVGHSGVGKSTLVNVIAPDAGRETGDVNAVTGRGRHTSTSVRAIRLDRGGWIIDTPGVRSFGLAHVDAERVVDAFPDLAGVTEGCPRSCSHDEPDCALNDVLDPQLRARVESLRRLIRSRTASTEDPADDVA